MADSLIDQALKLEGITGRKADFVKSIYHQESSSGSNTKTSNAGAHGVMQIIESTFKSVADKGWNINDPLQNLRGGIRYASKMFDAAKGDPAIAAAGYYGGMGGLMKAKKGVAVSDPKNPNAPTTLEYGQQVAGRMQDDPYLSDFMSRLKTTVATNKQAKEAAAQAQTASGDDLNAFMQTIKPQTAQAAQEAQPDTLTGDIGQGVSKLAGAAWNEGNVLTGIPKAAIGVAEAGLSGISGLPQMLAKGIYGTASGVAGMLPEAIGGGGGFEKGFQQGAQAVENVIPSAYSPQTNAGQAVGQIFGAIPAEFTRGGQAVGQSVENLTGSKVLGGIAASGTETLGNALSMGLPLGGRVAPRVIAGEQAVATAARRPVAEVAPQAIEQLQPKPAQPLAPTIEGLAAQAETMQRAETPVTATTEQAATVAESAPIVSKESVTPQVTAVAPELLDITRSKPIEGGQANLQQARHDVMRNIGLSDGEIRSGAVSGDSRILGQEKELAKADTEAGKAMQAQLDLENQKLTEYGDNIVRDTGGTFGAEAVHRGSTVITALDQIASHHIKGVTEDYKLADERSSGAGIPLGDFMAVLKDKANFKGGDGLSVQRDVFNVLRNRDYLDKNGQIKPLNATQAEGLRQQINESWDATKPQVKSAIATLVDALDNSVIKTLSKDEYATARARYKQYKDIFENPKGIAKILDADGPNGINRSISLEKIGEKMRQLAETDSAQFEHIKQILSNLPNETLQAAADKALGEIRAQIAERITSAKTPAAIEKAYAPYRGSKIRQIFGEELANKLENYVAGVGVLRTIDKNPSGTASTARNLIDKATRGGAIATGTAVGGVLSGGLGVAIGGLLGEAFAGRIKTHMLEAIDAKTLDKSMSPKQFEVMQKVYEAKIKALGNTSEMRQAEKLLNSGKDVPPKQLSNLSRRIESTKQWVDLSKLLTPEQRSTVKKVGVIAWLSQAGQEEQK